MNGLSVLKLLKLSTGDLLFSQHASNIYKVRKPRLTLGRLCPKLGHTTLVGLGSGRKLILNEHCEGGALHAGERRGGWVPGTGGQGR